MADLHETCANVGLDSRKYRPIAHTTPEGRVAVYLGGAYAHLTLGQALNLRDQLARAIDALQAPPTTPAAATPDGFEEQLRQWRLGNRRTPPMAHIGDARYAELERRALEALQSEAQP